MSILTRSVPVYCISRQKSLMVNTAISGQAELQCIASPLGDKYCSAGRQPWEGRECYLLWRWSGACRSVRKRQQWCRTLRPAPLQYRDGPTQHTGGSAIAPPPATLLNRYAIHCTAFSVCDKKKHKRGCVKNNPYGDAARLPAHRNLRNLRNIRFLNQI